MLHGSYSFPLISPVISTSPILRWADWRKLAEKYRTIGSCVFIFRQVSTARFSNRIPSPYHRLRYINVSSSALHHLINVVAASPYHRPNYQHRTIVNSRFQVWCFTASHRGDVSELEPEHSEVALRTYLDSEHGSSVWWIRPSLSWFLRWLRGVVPWN